MHYKIIGLFVLLMYAQINVCSKSKEILIKDASMNNQTLTITAKCKDNEECLFDGQDIFLDVYIANNETVEIGFPQAYLQKTGPVIKLTDTRTKAEAYVPTNPADSDLLEKFVLIQPGRSIIVRWVIKSQELKQFSGQSVDLSAEVIIMTKIQAGGKQVDFRGSDTRHIVSRNS